MQMTLEALARLRVKGGLRWGPPRPPQNPDTIRGRIWAVLRTGWHTQKQITQKLNLGDPRHASGIILQLRREGFNVLERGTRPKEYRL